MSKDPAFLFYSSDFLNGVSDLTMEERGQYITLLCLQHQKGFLTEKTIRLTVGSVSVDVLNKFQKDENGNYLQKRLQDEIYKRENFVESRRNNGSLGGRPKKDEKPLALPNEKPNGKPKHILHEDEIENVIISVDNIELRELFKTLFLTNKWIRKNISTLEAAIKKSKKYEDKFMIDLVEKAIIGEYQGLFFSNTEEDYKKYLDSKSLSREQKEVNYGNNKS